jgi:hypothetical protein
VADFPCKSFDNRSFHPSYPNPFKAGDDSRFGTSITGHPGPV